MPIGVYPRPSLEERLWPRIDKNGPVVRPELGCCEVWTGGLIKEGGYGQIHVGPGNKRALVHRLVYELRHGKLPESVLVLHHCDNPPCTRDEHHFVGDHTANARDKIAKGRGNLPLGEDHQLHKLTRAQVEEIRNTQGPRGTQSAFARRFGVTEACISSVIRQRTWRQAR